MHIQMRINNNDDDDDDTKTATATEDRIHSPFVLENGINTCDGGGVVFLFHRRQEKFAGNQPMQPKTFFINFFSLVFGFFCSSFFFPKRYCIYSVWAHTVLMLNEQKRLFFSFDVHFKSWSHTNRNVYDLILHAKS